MPLQSLLAGLMFHKPDNPITFLEQCLAKAHNSVDNVYDWNLFHGGNGGGGKEDTPLTPDILSDVVMSMVSLGSEPTTPSGVGKKDEEKLKEAVSKTILFVLG